MKRIYLYALSIVALCGLFTACYFISYQFALRDFNNKATEQRAGLNNSELMQIESVNAGNKTTITPDTKYVMQKYDMATKELTEKVENIPNDFIGYTREDLLEYLNTYSSNLTTNEYIDEYNKGFLSFQLESFSSDKVVVKKTYNSDAIKYKYYIGVRENMVVVYYSDKKTEYDKTDICVSDLPEEEQEKLLYGIYVKDEDEVYGILESYSS